LSGGGHEARFPQRQIFPYKFLLKHYPLRSPDQARRKIFAERLPRYHPRAKVIGWHIQYDHWKPDDEFLWQRSSLLRFEETETRREYLTEMLSGIGIGPRPPELQPSR